MIGRRPGALLLGLALALAACAGPRRARDSRPPRALEAGPPLSRDAALAIARDARTPARAVQSLEVHRLGFPLDRANVEWLREQGAAPEVVLYLEERANAEWRDRVAEDEADAVEVVPYAAPIGKGTDGYGDFAGSASELGGPGIERDVYVRGTPAGGLTHALRPAPGPEPFPHPHLEPPLPPPEPERLGN